MLATFDCSALPVFCENQLKNRPNRHPKLRNHPCIHHRTNKRHAIPTNRRYNTQDMVYYYGTRIRRTTRLIQKVSPYVSVHIIFTNRSAADATAKKELQLEKYRNDHAEHVLLMLRSTSASSYSLVFRLDFGRVFVFAFRGRLFSPGFFPADGVTGHFSRPSVDVQMLETDGRCFVRT